VIAAKWLVSGPKMWKVVTLEKIEKEIRKLSPEEQLELVEKLARQLRRTGIARKKELDWIKLYGLGKGLWKDEDAQTYVRRIREDRV
jgi:hypothetical protein